MKSEIDVPDGWEVKKLNDITENIRYGYTASSKQEKVGPKFLRITDIKEGYVDWNSVPYCRCKESDFKKYLLETGDIVFARTGATTGKSYLIKSAPDSIFASYLINVRINDKYSSKFIYYFFQTNEYWKQIKSNVAGSAQGGLNATKLSNLRILIPNSFDEQQKISHILSKVDEQIDTTKKIIDKTEELKKGLMQKLLTKGIGHTKFKKTEFDEIPEEWKIVKISDVSKTYAGGTPSRYNKSFFNGDILWVKSGEVDGQFIEKTSERITEEALHKSSAKIIPENTVLIAMYGATAGKVGFLKKEGTSNQAVLAIPNNKANFNSLFMYYLLSSKTEKIMKTTQGTGQPNLSKTLVERTKILLPTLKEQQKIADILSKADEQMQDNKKELNHLKELKKGLMQDLLTGKVRVSV